MDAQLEEKHRVAGAMNKPYTMMGLDVSYGIGALAVSGILGPRLARITHSGVVAILVVFGAALVLAYRLGSMHPWLPVFVISLKHRAEHYCSLKRSKRW